jgi:hypothetical protein
LVQQVPFARQTVLVVPPQLALEVHWTQLPLLVLQISAVLGNRSLHGGAPVASHREQVLFKHRGVPVVGHSPWARQLTHAPSARHLGEALFLAAHSVWPVEMGTEVQPRQMKRVGWQMGVVVPGHWLLAVHCTQAPLRQ